MEFLAHRGLWKEREERNSLSALFSALDKGYGIETDIRDLGGELVISHDTPAFGSCVTLDQLLQYYVDSKLTSKLALNIKSDGLQEKLQKKINEMNVRNYFVFDMSIPDTLGYLKNKMPVFIRRSELENYPELELKTQGVWLDELTRPWITKTVVCETLAEFPAVCVVSAELHGREYLTQWRQINEALQSGCSSEQILLCTDFPAEAERFFQ